MTTAELLAQEADIKAQIAAKLGDIVREDAQSQSDSETITDLMNKLHGIQDQLVASTAIDLFIDMTKKKTDASQGTSAR